MHSIEFLSWVAQGKSLKYPGNLRENSGNLVSQKCGHPEKFMKFAARVT